MEVMIPSRDMDFDFNSARSSPYMSTPSTPRRFGNYFYSVPSSPSRISEFYTEFDDKDTENYNLREKRLSSPEESDDRDFAFDIGEEITRISLSADELFDGGRIRPLNPSPRLLFEGEIDRKKSESSPKSARSSFSHGKQIIQNVFSPWRKDLDLSNEENGKNRATNERGGRERNRTSNLSPPRTARSLSPDRISENPWEMEKQQRQQNSNPLPSNSKPAITNSPRVSKRWSFKDLLLFRSASEGRATDRDRLRSSFRKHEDSKNSNRKGLVSPHELHYTANRAASEDMKKRTFLPYNQGILGRLSFNPAIHALSNGFGSLPHA